MAIASTKPTSTVPSLPPSPQTVKEKEIYKTVVADSAVQPIPSLVAYMDGAPWVANEYFSQLISRDNEIREVDMGSNAALQQYRNFKNQELRVQSDLSHSFDEDQGISTVSGTAIVGGFVPNKYDYFVTAAGLKGYGLFMLNGVARKTYEDTSVYEITYTLIGYTDQPTAKQAYEALKARVTQTFYYHKERLLEGLSPMLTEGDHGLSMALSKKDLSLMEQYFAMFFHRTDRLFALPNPDVYMFDSRFSEFIRKTVNRDLHPKYYEVQSVSVDRDLYLTHMGLYDAILNRDMSQLETTLNKVGVVGSSYFKNSSFSIGPNAWRVTHYVFPMPDKDAKNYNAVSIKALQGHLVECWNLGTEFQPEDLSWFESSENLCQYGDRVIPIVKPVHGDGFYVFSEDFYRGRAESLSLLEILVRDFIQGNTIHLNHLDYIYQRYTRWNALEKFYYLPILSLILQDAIRGFY